MYATVLVRETGDSAKLVARKKTILGEVELLPDLARSMSPLGPGVGMASLVCDASDKLHVLFHHCQFAPFSTPRYFTLDGSEWSRQKTIDNAVVDGFAGYGVHLGVTGTKKRAVYFFHKAGQTESPSADLRLASWDLVTDKPSIALLDQKIPSPNPISPRFRVAMQVDAYGLVHMAIVRPSLDGPSGYLEYVRQARSSAGTLTMLRDTIDPDVLSPDRAAEVDLVVDERGRPHIAYVSGRDGKVRYATRYDR